MKILYIGCLGENENYNIGDWACYEKFKEILGLDFEYTIKESEIESCDALVLGGGTILRACSPTLPEKLLQKNIPLFIVGSGIELYGYPEHNINHNFHKVLQRAKLIGVRGRLTYDFLKNQNYESEILGDIAICCNTTKEHTGKESKTIAFNIGSTRNYLYGTEQNLLDNARAIVKRLLDDGYKVKKFAMWEEDFHLLKQIGEGETHEFIPDLTKTLDFFKDCRMVIGEKLHTSILAFGCNVPFISLSYRHKCLDFASSLGSDFEKYFIKTDDEKIIEKTINMVNHIEKNYNLIKCKMEDIRDIYNTKQISFFEKMKNIIRPC